MLCFCEELFVSKHHDVFQALHYLSDDHLVAMVIEGYE